MKRGDRIKSEPSKGPSTAAEDVGATFYHFRPMMPREGQKCANGCCQYLNRAWVGEYTKLVRALDARRGEE